MVADVPPQAASQIHSFVFCLRALIWRKTAIAILSMMASNDADRRYDDEIARYDQAKRTGSLGSLRSYSTVNWRILQAWWAQKIG